MLMFSPVITDFVSLTDHPLALGIAGVIIIATFCTALMRWSSIPDR
jgi:hypothetical protein